ncbi:ComEC/Rec2 family competence protein [Riemerella columbina]|uniref:ComEC/Rec2 family competence protein n=1 Tax=Riemerella columbina TaxID=103810 RepID=UPI00036666ED|nr:ComEC/Rec2 family competence protein [Riemerella columbina]
MKQSLSFLYFIAFAVGVVLQDRLGWTIEEVSVVVSLGLVVLGGAILVKHYFISKYRIYILALFFVSIGVCSQFLASSSQCDKVLSKQGEFVFKLDEKLNANTRYQRYIVVILNQKTPQKVLFNVPKSSHPLDYRHYYRVEGFMPPLKSPLYSFQFDYAKYQARNGVFYQCYYKGLVQKGENQNLSFKDKMKQHRLDLIEKINHSRLSNVAKQFLKGIILADKTDMDVELISNFRKSGLAHILAISGTHIGIIFGFIFFVLRWLLPYQMRVGSIILSILLIWLFAWFIGGGNSVIRACAMLSAYFIFTLLQRKPNTLDALGLAGLGLLVVDLQQLFNVGFQLSFSAVLGIYWLYQPFLQLFPKTKISLVRLVYQTLSLTLAAQLGTLPLVLYYFHQYSGVSLLANLLIIPLVGVVIVASFIMTGFIYFGWDNQWLSTIYNVVIEYLLQLVEGFAKVDILSNDTIAFNIFEAILVMMMVYLLNRWLLKKSWRYGIHLLVLGFIFLIVRLGFNYYEHQTSEALWHSQGREHILSVKEQGQVSFWIPKTLDQNKVMQYIIKPYIISCRVSKYQVYRLPNDAKAIQYKDNIYHKP